MGQFALLQQSFFPSPGVYQESGGADAAPCTKRNGR